MKCNFNIAWVGYCKNDAPCKFHENLKCSVCGDKAVKECDETYQFVCGFPLCDKCICKCKSK